MKNKSLVAVTTSWDDGHPLDVKLADLLYEYGINGTFYVTPFNRERAVIELSDLRTLSERFEIGAHTLTHPDLRRLDDKQLENEVADSRSELENVLGTCVQMFCYPGGKYNRRVLNTVAKAGFIGARSTKMFHVALGKNPWRMPTTVYCKPFPMWIWYRHCLKTQNWFGLRKLFNMGFQKSWRQIAYAFFEIVLKEGGIWHLWGHSWEIEEHNLWDELRKVFEVVSRRSDVMYLTNGELVQMMLKQR